jgi:hypothetical protein
VVREEAEQEGEVEDVVLKSPSRRMHRSHPAGERRLFIPKIAISQYAYDQ